ncbi:hypothetical protein [Corynebacterium parakroppenstedtii]|uniref:hypothetical protein n=1 Tax=Corynebacterium parakroppenstedtii TaxID=2828363 RepID=UPI001C8CFD22|nr:hypothetical protein [Corynebacterium parakroppenstedtii]MBY0788430.1 hypothetical protein [Corynebacterium parakroppenstedtii]
MRKQVATLCLGAALGTVLVGCNSNDGNNNSPSTTTSTTTSRKTTSAPSSTRSSTASKSMKPTLDGSENNQPNPDVESSDADSQAEENNADAENQATVDVPSWVVGRWEGHRRLLEINPDGSGKLVADPPTGVGATKETLQLIDCSGDAGKGTITVKVVSSQNAGGDTTGKIYSFEVENGIASERGSAPFCNSELPEYKAEYGTMPMCGA